MNRVILNKDNAKTAKIIQNINHPEWGTKKFNYNDQPLSDGRYASTYGSGWNSVVLFESEYHFWEIIK